MIRRCTSRDVMQEYRLSRGEVLVTVTHKGTFSRRRVSKAPVLDVIERLDWVNEQGSRIKAVGLADMGPLKGQSAEVRIVDEDDGA